MYAIEWQVSIYQIKSCLMLFLGQFWQNFQISCKWDLKSQQPSVNPELEMNLSIFHSIGVFGYINISDINMKHKICHILGVPIWQKKIPKRNKASVDANPLLGINQS